MTSRRRSLLPGLALLLFSTTIASPAAAAPPATAPAPLPAQQRERLGESLGYLQVTYGVSDREAQRRLDVQGDAPAIEEALLRRFPNDYAGMWLDQPNGGVLVIRMVRPGLLTDSAAELAGVRYRVEGATWSLLDLRATRDRMAAAVPERVVSYVVDEQRNAVVAYDWAGGSATRAAAGRARTLASSEGGRVVPAPHQSAVKADQAAWLAAEDAAGARESQNEVSTQACYFTTCGGPPMRGGYRLKIPRDNGSDGFCTNGFNVKGSNGWEYTLTAGHCVLGPNHTRQDRSSHNNIGVGYELNTMRNPTYPVDYAIMPFQGALSASYWFPAGKPKNMVYSECRADSPRAGCRNGDFSMSGIHSYDAVRVGWVVCHTGSATPDYGGSSWAPGTRCGVVTVKDGGIRTNLCSRPTDSGGPLFSQIDNRAYGILTGGTSVPGGGYCGINGPEYSRFSPLSKIFVDAQLKSGVRISLITG